MSIYCPSGNNRSYVCLLALPNESQTRVVVVSLDSLRQKAPECLGMIPAVSADRPSYLGEVL